MSAGTQPSQGSAEQCCTRCELPYQTGPGLNLDGHSSLKGCIDALKAERAWRRPDTAPFTEDPTKTISYVLVDNGHHVGVGYRWRSEWDGDPEWYDESGAEIDPPPTGWMPVPQGQKGSAP